MNRRSATLIALLAFTTTAPLLTAAETSSEKLCTALQRVGYFSVWGHGYAGTPTANEQMFRAFMEKRPGVEDALRLIADGTPAGKIYGFLALKKLSPELFAKVAPRFFRKRDEVSILSGCSPSTQSAGALVKMISDETIELRKKRE